MINDYLKTSLVFYDDINRQHRHNGCCQDATDWDIPKTAPNRLIPFQIKIHTYDWLGDINTVRLYDTEDTLVANLITDYGIYPQIKVISNCNWQNEWVWLIYDADRPLSDNLPTGDHYIEIRDDRGNAWYSEVFRICNTTNVYHDSPQLFDDWESYTYFTFETDGQNIVRASRPAAATADSYSWCFYADVGDVFDYIIEVEEIVAWGEFPFFRLETDGGAVASNTLHTNANEAYVGTFTATQAGYLHLGIGTNGRADYSANITLTKRLVKTYEGMIGIEWFNECDFDDIIYQELDKWAILLCPYENRLNFNTNVEILSTETTKNTDDSLGKDFFKSIIQKTYYRFRVLVPEWLYLVLQTLQAYANNSRGTVNVYLPNGDTGYIEELNITEEKLEANCYYSLSIEFREEAKVWTNCCENYALIDESSCVDDVSYG